MRLGRSVLTLALGAALCGGLSGCGDEDVDRAADDARERLEEVRRDARDRIERAREEFEERRERYGRRIEEVLDEIDGVFERPAETRPVGRSLGRDEPQTIDAFLTSLLGDIDRYWTRTLAAADLPEPRVSYDWIPPGRVARTSCNTVARDMSAFYCPADDRIYVGQQFAAALYRGVLRGLPGESAGYGRAVGDFAVAYVVAHEYGHNLQQELGVFDNAVSETARPFELQADCFAGNWAFSVYEEGLLEPGDLQEATDAALAVGDFDAGNEQHHGTPEERRDALLAGFDSGDPSVCSRFLPS
jgi:predicted metalloprotease